MRWYIYLIYVIIIVHISAHVLKYYICGQNNLKNSFPQQWIKGHSLFNSVPRSISCEPLARTKNDRALFSGDSCFSLLIWKIISSTESNCTKTYEINSRHFVQSIVHVITHLLITFFWWRLFAVIGLRFLILISASREQMCMRLISSKIFSKNNLSLVEFTRSSYVCLISSIELQVTE